jgi:5-methylcytosine-specific restriction endonuclease McrA
MRTLVLNKNWMPINHTDWKRAFRLIAKGRAEVLEYYEDKVVGASKDFVFVPAVIRLTHYDKMPKCKVSYSKRTICERDEWACQYCGIELTLRTATIDHVVPRCEGGKTTFENTVASCFPCNNKKGPKLLKHTSLKLRNYPERPSHQNYRLYLGSYIQPEWTQYLPKGMMNGF